jgi:hypothetical protein
MDLDEISTPRDFQRERRFRIGQQPYATCRRR